MVKFYKMPKFEDYAGELEEVSYTFVVPVEKHKRSGFTGFEALDRMIRPVIKGIAQKPIQFNGFKFKEVKRKKLK